MERISIKTGTTPRVCSMIEAYDNPQVIQWFDDLSKMGKGWINNDTQAIWSFDSSSKEATVTSLAHMSDRVAYRILKDKLKWKVSILPLRMVNGVLTNIPEEDQHIMDFLFKSGLFKE